MDRRADRHASGGRAADARVRARPRRHLRGRAPAAAFGIVAEEDYVQDVRPSAAGTISRGATPRVTHRELKSDLLLVRPIGSNRWMQFRDVFEVDGQPVRDRSERLMKLFVSPSSATANQAELIAEESSRYNIGNLQRTLNVPLLALAILDPAQQQRFVFK